MKTIYIINKYNTKITVIPIYLKYRCKKQKIFIIT